jgi:hypothetical protein
VAAGKDTFRTNESGAHGIVPRFSVSGLMKRYRT